MQNKIKNVFDWQGPSVYTLDKKLRQVASGVRAGQLSRQREIDKLNEQRQVLIYSKGK